MVSWSELDPPNLEIADRGVVAITSGSEARVEDVAAEGEEISVFYGHTDQSNDGSSVTVAIDDDGPNQTLDLIFSESTAAGDAEVSYTVVRIIP